MKWTRTRLASDALVLHSRNAFWYCPGQLRGLLQEAMNNAELRRARNHLPRSWPGKGGRDRNGERAGFAKLSRSIPVRPVERLSRLADEFTMGADAYRCALCR